MEFDAVSLAGGGVEAMALQVESAEYRTAVVTAPTAVLALAASFTEAPHPISQ